MAPDTTWAALSRTGLLTKENPQVRSGCNCRSFGNHEGRNAEGRSGGDFACHAALILTLLLVPIAVIDNLVKPILMARGLLTPMLVILVGVIGGTLSYGLIGLFLGPVVLRVFYELLLTWVTIEPPASEMTKEA